MWGLSLVVASGGHSSSRCTGLSLSRPLLLQSTGSRRAGSVTVAHGPSCSAACGIFPDQGSNLCPLHWQADSQPLCHQGSPDTLVLMSDAGSLLSWFKNWWGLLKDCKKPRLCSWTVGTHACLFTVIVQRQQIENCMGLWLACWDCPSTHHRLYRQPAPAPLALALLSTILEAAVANKSAHN